MAPARHARIVRRAAAPPQGSADLLEFFFASARIAAGAGHSPEAIRRALQQPVKQHVTQTPPDECTRILVAEADPYHRRVLRVLLASPRISAIEVEDGQSAIDILA